MSRPQVRTEYLSLDTKQRMEAYIERVYFGKLKYFHQKNAHAQDMLTLNDLYIIFRGDSPMSQAKLKVVYDIEIDLIAAGEIPK